MKRFFLFMLIILAGCGISEADQAATESERDARETRVYGSQTARANPDSPATVQAQQLQTDTASSAMTREANVTPSPISSDTLIDQIESVVFGDVTEAEISITQVLAIWEHGGVYRLSALEDEMGEVICYLRENVNDTLPYRLVIKIDVVDAAGNESSVNGVLGVFTPELYADLNCENYTLFDLAALADSWDVHRLVE